MGRYLLAASIALVGPLLYLACTTAPPDRGAMLPDASGLEGGAADDLDASVLLPLFEDVESGGSCEASTDCPPGLVCWYPLSEGCTATGVCTVLATSQCGGPYCTCRGDTTAACGDYGQLPMEAPLHGPPCGANGDAASDEADAGEANGGDD
jgi:hypothetical protein